MYMDILVSVIVPVYNSESYLMRCINSLYEQTYKNIEIILINDGSTDASGAICDQLHCKDNRIKVIHKKNEGLGLARNDGLKIASGDYVIFVDSDDFIEDNDAIEKLVAIVCKSPSDILCTRFIYDDKKEESIFKEGVYEQGENINNILINMLGYLRKDKNHFNVSACTKMYDSNFLKEQKLKFYSERKLIWEDMAFNFDAISKAKRIYIMDYAYYHYCYNSDSTTHKYDSGKFEKIMIMYEYMKNKVIEKKLPQEACERLNNMFMGNIYTCIKLEVLFARENGINNALNSIEKITRDERMTDLLNSLNCKQLSFIQQVFNGCLKYRLNHLVFILAAAQNIKKRNLIN